MNWQHPVKALDQWWTRRIADGRVDRNPLAICALLGLMGPTLAIILTGPAPSSVLSGMPDDLQVTMCAFIFVGCGGMLHGAMLGARWYFYGTRRTALRRSYTSAPLAVSGLVVYGGFILGNTDGNVIAALSGILTPALGLGLLLLAGKYWLEERRMQRLEPLVVEQILSEAAEAKAADDCAARDE